MSGLNRSAGGNNMSGLNRYTYVRAAAASLRAAVHPLMDLSSRAFPRSDLVRIAWDDVIKAINRVNDAVFQQEKMDVGMELDAEEPKNGD